MTEQACWNHLYGWVYKGWPYWAHPGQVFYLNSGVEKIMHEPYEAA